MLYVADGVPVSIQRREQIGRRTGLYQAPVRRARKHGMAWDGMAWQGSAIAREALVIQTAPKYALRGEGVSGSWRGANGVPAPLAQCTPKTTNTISHNDQAANFRSQSQLPARWSHCPGGQPIIRSQALRRAGGNIWVLKPRPWCFDTGVGAGKPVAGWPRGDWREHELLACLLEAFLIRSHRPLSAPCQPFPPPPHCCTSSVLHPPVSGRGGRATRPLRQSLRGCVERETGWALRLLSLLAHFRFSSLSCLPSTIAASDRGDGGGGREAPAQHASQVLPCPLCERERKKERAGPPRALRCVALIPGEREDRNRNDEPRDVYARSECVPSDQYPNQSAPTPGRTA